MKDYYKLDKNFILNYKVKKDNIIINFSNGEKWIADKNNTNIVNLIMKKQVKKMNKENLINEKNKTIRKNVLLTSLTVLGVLLALVFSFSNVLISYMFALISFVGGIFVCENIPKLSEINDGLKNIEFIENEELINEELKKEDVLINSPRKVKKIVSKRKEEPAFDINNIDKLSSNELKELLKVIENVKSFTSDEENKEELDKGRQLIMKKPN